MRGSAQALLLLGLMAVSIVASGLLAASADRELLSPPPVTAPPQLQAEASARPTETPLPRNSKDRGPAPRVVRTAPRGGDGEPGR